MKLTLEDKHTKLILETLLAVSANAYAGNDVNLADNLRLFSNRFTGSRAYVSLKREEAKSLKDFVDSVQMSLKKLIKDAEAREDLEDKEAILKKAQEHVDVAEEIIQYINKKLMGEVVK